MYVSNFTVSWQRLKLKRCFYAIFQFFTFKTLFQFSHETKCFQEGHQIYYAKIPFSSYCMFRAIYIFLYWNIKKLNSFFPKFNLNFLIFSIFLFKLPLSLKRMNILKFYIDSQNKCFFVISFLTLEIPSVALKFSQ